MHPDEIPMWMVYIGWFLLISVGLIGASAVLRFCYEILTGRYK